MSLNNGKMQAKHHHHQRGKSNTSDGFGEFMETSTDKTSFDDSISHPEQVDEPKEGNGDSFIDDDEWQEADLVAGFSPTSSNSHNKTNFIESPTAKVQHQLDDLAWEAWETPRGPTPGPNDESKKTQNASKKDEDFLAAFERISMSQKTNVQRKPSPPIIDLRGMEKKLELEKKGLKPEDLQFFESFEDNPRAIMANNRTQSHEGSILQGEQLNSMQEAQVSPMDIQTPKKSENDNYFDNFQEGQPSSSNRSSLTRSGSWTETAGGWAGSFRRTLGSIRGHLPSVQDFIVPEGEGDEEGDKDQTRPKTPENQQNDEGDNLSPIHHRHPRKLADLSAFSQSTPFSSHTDPSSPPGPLRRDSGGGGGAGLRVHPIAGHHSVAPISGAPGFNPNSGKNWNTGSWSLSSKEEVERRRNPIPVTLLGRREETQEVVEDDLAASLTAHLPKRHQLGKSWKLLYSSDQHGVSLGTLYHKVEVGLDLRKQNARGARKSSIGGGAGGVNEAEGWLRGASETTKAALTGGGVQRVGGGLHLNEAGLILAIKDDEEHVFGAFINERLRPQSSYYGNGECFLWKTTDEKKLKTFDWTGRNDYMVLTESHYLSVGGGEGKYGLWLDGRLEQGISACCPAFDNQILCDGKDDKEHSKSEGRFECITLEVWACGID